METSSFLGSTPGANTNTCTSAGVWMTLIAGKLPRGDERMAPDEDEPSASISSSSRCRCQKSSTSELCGLINLPNIQPSLSVIWSRTAAYGRVDGRNFKGARSAGTGRPAAETDCCYPGRDALAASRPLGPSGNLPFGWP